MHQVAVIHLGFQPLDFILMLPLHVRDFLRHVLTQGTRRTFIAFKGNLLVVFAAQLHVYRFLRVLRLDLSASMAGNFGLPKNLPSVLQ